MQTHRLWHWPTIKSTECQGLALAVWLINLSLTFSRDKFITYDSRLIDTSTFKSEVGGGGGEPSKSFNPFPSSYSI